jgi:hypothetical protein
MFLFAAAMALALPAAQAQDCAEATTSAQLDDTLNAAEAAWTKADEAGFLLRMEEAVLLLPCVAEPLEPSMAARYHRDLGLWLFASQQPDMAQAAFAAARRVEPEASLPAELAPEGHPVRKLFDASTPGDASQDAPRPATGQVLFDGSTGDRPVLESTIFQLEADGAASLTRYLRPDAALPEYPIWVAPPETGPQGWHFAVGAGVLAAASGGMMLAAKNTHDTFIDDPPANKDDLDALYSRNRGLSTGSAILAGTAGAMGVVAVFTW